MFAAHINTDQPESLVDMIDITGNNRCNLGSLKTHQKQRKLYDLIMHFNQMCIRWFFASRFNAIWMIPGKKKIHKLQQHKTKITIKT